ncbi:CTP-dependent riboflavin kinase [Candidatus Woesearchaeota archaeon]|nr:CTP-dependent riboflavin kinase [Candidatus Woesearchaeota archaeon]
MENYFGYLLHIGKKGGMFSTITVSTLSSSKELKKSQQSLSRIFIEMEKKGLIERKPSYQGLEVSLTEKGRNVLKDNYNNLKKIFETKEELTGKVKSGMGEGSWYIRKYALRIKKALGFLPYDGTLNIEVKLEEEKRFISQMNSVDVEEFTSEGRTFGRIKLYKIKINKSVEGAIVIPERARHPEHIIEVIAPVCLRKELDLKDNSTVGLS